MSAVVSQITGITTVLSTVCSGVHQRKHQSYASLAFVRGIHLEEPGELFLFDDVIMIMRTKLSHLATSLQQLLAVGLPQATSKTRYHDNLTLDIHTKASAKREWAEMSSSIAPHPLIGIYNIIQSVKNTLFDCFICITTWLLSNDKYIVRELFRCIATASEAKHFESCLTGAAFFLLWFLLWQIK